MSITNKRSKGELSNAVSDSVAEEGRTVWELLAECVRLTSDTSYAVHGFPVTDLAKAAGSMNTINEKTALEYALGDSLLKKRSTVIVKNVGMNALADPLVMASTQGLVGGVVIISGDDTGVRGTQVRQDTGPYAEVASVPLVELDTDAVCRSLETAFAESERYSRVAILRATDIALNSTTREEPFPISSERRYGSLAERELSMEEGAERADRIFRGEADVPATIGNKGRILGLCRNCPYKR